MKSSEDPAFRAFLMSALRRSSRFWKPINECKSNARISRGLYKCQNITCGKVVGPKDIKVDHIEPVIPLSGFPGWDAIIKRLFCAVEGLQAICRACHKEKTQSENEQRKKIRKEKGVLNYRKNRRKKID